MHKSSEFEFEKIEAIIVDMLLFVVLGVRLAVSFVNEGLNYVDDKIC